MTRYTDAHLEGRSHRTLPARPRVVRLFRQLYTLRNQILHGAATDTGRRNRKSLQNAIPALAACLPVFIDVVR